MKSKFQTVRPINESLGLSIKFSLDKQILVSLTLVLVLDKMNVGFNYVTENKTPTTDT